MEGLTLYCGGKVAYMHMNIIHAHATLNFSIKKSSSVTSHRSVRNPAATVCLQLSQVSKASNGACPRKFTCCSQSLHIQRPPKHEVSSLLHVSARASAARPIACEHSDPASAVGLCSMTEKQLGSMNWKLPYAGLCARTLGMRQVSSKRCRMGRGRKRMPLLPGNRKDGIVHGILARHSVPCLLCLVTLVTSESMR